MEPFLDTVAPVLAALFDPAPVPALDLVGEVAGAELRAARVELVDGVLRGEIEGADLAGAGAWMLVDSRGGPAPDLQIGVGLNWLRMADVEDWTPGPARIAEGRSVVEGERLHFSIDLRQTGRWEPGHAGAITAEVTSFDRASRDPGPGGAHGPAADGAWVVLAHLLQDPRATEDPDLVAALALGFGGLYPLVAEELRPTVLADAAAWLDYAFGLDLWLTDAGASWRLRTLSPEAKLLWAWPAGQSVLYGVRPLGKHEEPIGPEMWRYMVPDVATLVRLRDEAPVQPELGLTAELVDRGVWERLRYRAAPEVMSAWCASGSLDAMTCAAWQADLRQGLDLGRVDGRVVGLDQGPSATLQLAVFHRRRQYIGDCVTATAIVTSTFQALGIAPLALGWNGPDLDSPTHDLPLYVDGEVLRAPQSAPGRGRATERAWVYLTLPVLQPWRSLGAGWEPGGGARGGAIAGGWLGWGQLRAELEQGLPLATITDFIRVGAGGSWPGW